MIEPEPEEGSPRSVVMEISDGGSFPRYGWGGGGDEGGNVFGVLLWDAEESVKASLHTP